MSRWNGTLFLQDAEDLLGSLLPEYTPRKARLLVRKLLCVETSLKFLGDPDPTTVVMLDGNTSISVTRSQWESIVLDSFIDTEYGGLTPSLDEITPSVLHAIVNNGSYSGSIPAGVIEVVRNLVKGFEAYHTDKDSVESDPASAFRVALTELPIAPTSLALPFVKYQEVNADIIDELKDEWLGVSEHEEISAAKFLADKLSTILEPYLAGVQAQEEFIATASSENSPMIQPILALFPTPVKMPSAEYTGFNLTQDAALGTVLDQVRGDDDFVGNRNHFLLDLLNRFLFGEDFHPPSPGEDAMYTYFKDENSSKSFTLDYEVYSNLTKAVFRDFFGALHDANMGIEPRYFMGYIRQILPDSDFTTDSNKAYMKVTKDYRDYVAIQNDGDDSAAGEVISAMEAYTEGLKMYVGAKADMAEAGVVDTFLVRLTDLPDIVVPQGDDGADSISQPIAVPLSQLSGITGNMNVIVQNYDDFAGICPDDQDARAFLQKHLASPETSTDPNFFQSRPEVTKDIIQDLDLVVSGDGAGALLLQSFLELVRSQINTLRLIPDHFKLNASLQVTDPASDHHPKTLGDVVRHLGDSSDFTSQDYIPHNGRTLLRDRKKNPYEKYNGESEGPEERTERQFLAFLYRPFFEMFRFHTNDFDAVWKMHKELSSSDLSTTYDDFVGSGPYQVWVNSLKDDQRNYLEENEAERKASFVRVQKYIDALEKVMDHLDQEDVDSSDTEHRYPPEEDQAPEQYKLYEALIFHPKVPTDYLWDVDNRILSSTGLVYYTLNGVDTKTLCTPLEMLNELEIHPPEGIGGIITNEELYDADANLNGMLKSALDEYRDMEFEQWNQFVQSILSESKWVPHPVAFVRASLYVLLKRYYHQNIMKTSEYAASPLSPDATSPLSPEVKRAEVDLFIQTVVDTMGVYGDNNPDDVEKARQHSMLYRLLQKDYEQLPNLLDGMSLILYHRFVECATDDRKYNSVDDDYSNVDVDGNAGDTSRNVQKWFYYNHFNENVLRGVHEDATHTPPLPVGVDIDVPSVFPISNLEITDGVRDIENSEGLLYQDFDATRKMLVWSEQAFVDAKEEHKTAYQAWLVAVQQHDDAKLSYTTEMQERLNGTATDADVAAAYDDFKDKEEAKDDAVLEEVTAKQKVQERRAWMCAFLECWETVENQTPELNFEKAQDVPSTTEDFLLGKVTLRVERETCGLAPFNSTSLPTHYLRNKTYTKNDVVDIGSGIEIRISAAPSDGLFSTVQLKEVHNRSGVEEAKIVLSPTGTPVWEIRRNAIVTPGTKNEDENDADFFHRRMRALQQLADEKRDYPGVGPKGGGVDFNPMYTFSCDAKDSTDSPIQSISMELQKVVCDLGDQVVAVGVDGDQTKRRRYVTTENNKRFRIELDDLGFHTQVVDDSQDHPEACFFQVFRDFVPVDALCVNVQAGAYFRTGEGEGVVVTDIQEQLYMVQELCELFNHENNYTQLEWLDDTKKFRLSQKDSNTPLVFHMSRPLLVALGFSIQGVDVSETVMFDGTDAKPANREVSSTETFSVTADMKITRSNGVPTQDIPPPPESIPVGKYTVEEICKLADDGTAGASFPTIEAVRVSDDSTSGRVIVNVDFSGSSKSSITVPGALAVFLGLCYPAEKRLLKDVSEVTSDSKQSVLRSVVRPRVQVFSGSHIQIAASGENSNWEKQKEIPEGYYSIKELVDVVNEISEVPGDILSYVLDSKQLNLAVPAGQKVILSAPLARSLGLYPSDPQSWDGTPPPDCVFTTKTQGAYVGNLQPSITGTHVAVVEPTKSYLGNEVKHELVFENGQIELQGTPLVTFSGGHFTISPLEGKRVSIPWELADQLGLCEISFESDVAIEEEVVLTEFYLPPPYSSVWDIKDNFLVTLGTDREKKDEEDETFDLSLKLTAQNGADSSPYTYTPPRNHWALKFTPEMCIAVVGNRFIKSVSRLVDPDSSSSDPLSVQMCTTGGEKEVSISSVDKTRDEDGWTGKKVSVLRRIEDTGNAEMGDTQMIDGWSEGGFIPGTVSYIQAQSNDVLDIEEEPADETHVYTHRVHIKLDIAALLNQAYDTDNFRNGVVPFPHVNPDVEGTDDDPDPVKAMNNPEYWTFVRERHANDGDEAEQQAYTYASDGKLVDMKFGAPMLRPVLEHLLTKDDGLFVKTRGQDNYTVVDEHGCGSKAPLSMQVKQGLYKLFDVTLQDQQKYSMSDDKVQRWLYIPIPKENSTKNYDGGVYSSSVLVEDDPGTMHPVLNKLITAEMLHEALYKSHAMEFNRFINDPSMLVPAIGFKKENDSNPKWHFPDGYKLGFISKILADRPLTRDPTDHKLTTWLIVLEQKTETSDAVTSTTRNAVFRGTK